MLLQLINQREDEITQKKVVMSGKVVSNTTHGRASR